MLTIKVPLLSLLHVSGSIERISDDVNQVKDITKNTNNKIDRIEGMHI